MTRKLAVLAGAGCIFLLAACGSGGGVSIESAVGDYTAKHASHCASTDEVKAGLVLYNCGFFRPSAGSCLNGQQLAARRVARRQCNERSGASYSGRYAVSCVHAHLDVV